MSTYAIQIRSADDRWRIFRPIFTGIHSAVREYSRACDALPLDGIRLIDAATGETIEMRMPEVRATQTSGRA